MATHNDTGNFGEQLAKKYLENKGYKILETNYRYRKAEIDIIAIKDQTLAVVEVKTRSSSAYGLPQSFINQKKIRLIMEASNHYITTHQLDVNVSLDIISIILTQPVTIEHIEHAYYPF